MATALVTMSFLIDANHVTTLTEAAKNVIDDVVAILEGRTKLIIEDWHVDVEPEEEGETLL